MEMTPSFGGPGTDRGVVVTGPVGRARRRRRQAAALRDPLLARREHQRHRRGGGDPLRLSDSADDARRIIALAPDVPPLTWGRDERNAGEMWNSNSVIAWLVKRAGLAAEQVRPPRGGRAPGWRAGVTVARHREGGPR